MPATTKNRQNTGATPKQPVPEKLPKPRPTKAERAARPRPPAKPKGKAKSDETRDLSIPAPNIRVLEFKVTGTAPYVQSRFSAKATIMAAQAEGGGAKARKKAPKDFKALYEQAMHKSRAGWIGIPAMSFRAAMISACRLVGFQMTKAKLSIFIIADDVNEDGDPLVRIQGTPEMHTAHVRNETGVVDIRARPMWREWSCKLRVQYDADQFSSKDVANLLLRAGMQVGIGEGRADSKKSHTGMGWGSFTIEG